MKPAPGDRQQRIRIMGLELEELKKHTWMMGDAFGLDRRIERYQGKRPIGFYRWDLDCLVDGLETILEDPCEYPDKSSPGYKVLKTLCERLRKLREQAYADITFSPQQEEGSFYP